MKALEGAFNQEKAFVWGLLRDCEIFVYLWITFGLVIIHTTAAQVTMMHWTQRSGSSDSSGGQHIEHIIRRILPIQLVTLYHLYFSPERDQLSTDGWMLQI